MDVSFYSFEGALHFCLCAQLQKFTHGAQSGLLSRVSTPTKATMGFTPGVGTILAGNAIQAKGRRFLFRLPSVGVLGVIVTG